MSWAQPLGAGNAISDMPWSRKCRSRCRRRASSTLTPVVPPAKRRHRPRTGPRRLGEVGGVDAKANITMPSTSARTISSRSELGLPVPVRAAIGVVAVLADGVVQAAGTAG